MKLFGVVPTGTIAALVLSFFAGNVKAAAPTITSCDPLRGPVGSTVTITGTNFTPPLSIVFAGNVQAEGSFTATQIMAYVPSGAQTGPITVNTGGGSATTPVFTVGSAMTPSVSLAATTASTTVGSGMPGIFTLTLSQASSSNLVVSYTVGGSGVNGTDYKTLSGTTNLKAGVTSKDIKVQPMGDLEGAAKKTVTLTLSGGTGYTVGSEDEAKVKIHPAD